MANNVMEEVYAWKGLGRDGPGPTFSFYSDGTFRVTLADGKGTITLDPQGNVVASPADGTISGFGGGSATEISGSGGTLDAADPGGIAATVAASKKFSVRSTDLVNNTPANDAAGQVFQVTSLNVQGDSVARQAFAVDEYEGRVYVLNGFDFRIVGTGTAKLQFGDDGGVVDHHDGGLGGITAGATVLDISGAGDITLTPAPGGKHGFFGSAGTARAAASSIADLAALKAYLTNLGLLS